MQGNLVNGAGKGSCRGLLFMHCVKHMHGKQRGARPQIYLFLHLEEECRVDRLTGNGIMPVQYCLY